ncbi:MAG: tetratricopeptide repeat protein [Synechococcales bacterium]|nr:tetratricopeptide repeat protein [Synechococcales bacterium]
MLETLLAMTGPWGIVVPIFWAWMIFDCVKNEPDRQTWLWILLFLNAFGALIYFLTRWLPRANLPQLKRFQYRQKLWNAEAAVRNLGKAHQYVGLGDVLVEMGEWNRAREAFQQALDKEPKNVNALWGSALVAMHDKQYAIARDLLAAILKTDFEARFGEVSLLYGQALFELPDWQTAKPHLEKDIRFWSHPESSLRLALILSQEGQKAEARDRLQTMLDRIQASPMYHHRRHRSTIRQAEKLLRSL